MKNFIMLLVMIFATMVYGQSEREIQTSILNLKQQASAPASPASGQFKAYIRDGKMRVKNSSGVESTVGTGGGSRLNLMTDGSFEDGITEGSCSGCTASQESSALMITPTNLKSLKLSFAASTGSYTVDKTTGSQFASVPGASVCWIRTNQSGVKFIARAAGSDSSVLIKDIPSDNIARPFEIPLVMDGTSNGFKVSATSSITGDVYVDECEVGPRKLLGQVPSIGPWTSYTCPMTWVSNATCSGYWRQVGEEMEVRTRVLLSGAPTAATLYLGLPSGYTIDTTKIPSGMDIVPVGASYYRDVSASTNAMQFVNLDSALTTQVVPWSAIASPNASNNGNVITATIPFTFASGDYIHSSFKVPITQFAGSASTYSSFNADTDWESCGHVAGDFTGFGTPSTIETQCRRQGPNLIMRGKFVAGTSTAVEARLALKFRGQSLTSKGSPAITSISAASAAGPLNVNSATQVTVLIEPSVGYVTFGQQAAGASGLTKSTASSFLVSGQGYSIPNAVIPIQGWDQSNVMIASFLDMLGSQGAGSGADIQAVYFGNGTDCATTCTTGTCGICFQMGSKITSVTWSSLGAYRFNGLDGTKYSCAGSGNGSAFAVMSSRKDLSTSSYTLIQSGSAATGVNVNMAAVFCFAKP